MKEEIEDLKPNYVLLAVVLLGVAFALLILKMIL